MSDPELRSEQRAQCEQNAGLLLIDDVNPQIFGAKQVKARARGDRCVARQACWLDRYLISCLTMCAAHAKGSGQSILIT